LDPKFLRREEVIRSFPPQSWQRTVFSELGAAFESTVRPYPCIFGAAGYRADSLRFLFLERITPRALGPVLRTYLAQAREHGCHASLVIFEHPEEVRPMETYRKRFWRLLRGLARIDAHPWPTDIPRNLDDPGWEFCFSGEPVFVVCNTPAHVRRQSRRSSGFMITMQPRWVFEGITDKERSARAAFAAVRRRLAEYDMLEPSPSLGRYGDPETREYAQYFIADENSAPVCPMASLPSPDRRFRSPSREPAQ
jgi:FPC/CPF motif-containing protein YcgG